MEEYYTLVSGEEKLIEEMTREELETELKISFRKVRLLKSDNDNLLYILEKIEGWEGMK